MIARVGGHWSRQCAHVKGSTQVATFLPRNGALDKIECFLDRDWGCDDFDRKSVSSGYLLTGGCKLRSRSRTTNRHALSSLRSLWLNIDTLLLATFLQAGQ